MPAPKNSVSSILVIDMAKCFVDFYDLLDLDRTRDTESLQKQIRQVIREKRKQRGFAQGGSESKKLKDEVELYYDALKYFTNDASRKRYDAELAQAVAKNENFHRPRPKADDLFGNAIEMFNSQRYDMTYELLVELLSETPNNEKAWQLLGDTKYMMGDYDDALHVVNKAAKAFPMSIDLRFRDIRFNILLDNFNEAQALLNKAMADFPDSPVFASEQIYLYLAAGKIDLAKKFIDEYIETKPSDSEFRHLTAENLTDIATQNYVIDPESRQRFPITQANYDLCLKLITWANQIWQDQSTLAALDHIRELGTMHFDQSQVKKIVLCAIVGIVPIFIFFTFIINNIDSHNIMQVLFSPATVLVAIPIAFAYSIWKKSRRPLWMEYRDTLRGYSDAQLSSDFI